MVKFLYSLVSKESDIYYEQTLVSMLSLRHYNPGAFVSLLVDDKTDSTLVGFRAKIKDLVDEYRVIPFDEGTSCMVRSRLLKTSMRHWIDGDFVYIDGDTAIAAPLNIKVADDCDIAAVPDLHGRERDRYHVKHKRMNRQKEILGFGLSLANLYYNSGVIFVRDSDRSRQFFKKWNELYCYCTTKGIYTDQISFNECNRLLGFPMKELSGDWNCQVREAYNHLYRVKVIFPLLCSAKIIHFFGSGIDGRTEPHPLMKKDFFEGIKRRGRITESELQMIFDAKNSFYGATVPLDGNNKFPMFFTYRQFPRLFRFVSAFQKKWNEIC